MNIFEKLSRFFLLILSYIVLTSLVYILPAIAVSVIAWDKSIYLSCVSNPAYMFVFGLLSLIGIGVYIIDISDRYLA